MEPRLRFVAFEHDCQMRFWNFLLHVYASIARTLCYFCQSLNLPSSISSNVYSFWNIFMKMRVILKSI